MLPPALGARLSHRDLTPTPPSAVNKLYEVYYSDVWANMGWLALFVPCFFAANALALRFVRHIVR